MYPSGGSPWRRLLVPAAGSLVTGHLLFRYFFNARGSGIPQTKALFAHEGHIKLRTVMGSLLGVITLTDISPCLWHLPLELNRSAHLSQPPTRQ